MAYNRSSGGNTSEISEILEPLHACLKELIERDHLNKSHLIEYTDRDVVAISMMYAHILGNRLIHNLTDEKASLGLSQHLATTYGNMIHDITESMSGVDVRVYSNSKGKG